MLDANMADSSQSTNRRHFSAITTLALATVLLVPLAVRTMTNLEPYPAFLFPGAGGLLYIEDGKAIVQYLTLHGRNADGVLERLTSASSSPRCPLTTYGPLPTTSLARVRRPARKCRSSERQVRVPKRVPSWEDRRAALDWLADRVRQDDPRATALVLRFQVGHFNLKRGEESSQSVLNEVVVPLP